MSLDPHWFSTIYGVLFMVGPGALRLALVIVLRGAASGGEPPLARACCADARVHDLGKLMLAFVMLWAYFYFSQFLIIWSGNLPEEMPWYIAPAARRLAVRWRSCWSSSTSRCPSCCCSRAT